MKATKPEPPIRPTPRELEIAMKLLAIGLKERRRVEGYNDDMDWHTMTDAQCSAWCRIARALLNKEIEI